MWTTAPQIELQLGKNPLSQQIQYIYWFAIRMWYIQLKWQQIERVWARPRQSKEKLIICFRSFGTCFFRSVSKFIRSPSHTPEARTKLPSIHIFIATQNKFIYFVAFIPPSAERAFATSCVRWLCRMRRTGVFYCWMCVRACVCANAHCLCMRAHVLLFLDNDIWSLYYFAKLFIVWNKWTANNG